MYAGHAITMQSLPVKDLKHKLVYLGGKSQFNQNPLLSDHEFEKSAIMRF